MDFNARQMMIFEANLNAIEDENLKKELSEIVAKDYQFSQGDDPLDINANGGGGELLTFSKSFRRSSK